jgi:hypothetical protein
MTPIHTQTFVFNPEDNSGESLSLTTKYFDNGDGVVSAKHALTLQSYCNSATFELTMAITPEVCRLLARALDVGEQIAQTKLNQS